MKNERPANPAQEIARVLHLLLKELTTEPQHLKLTGAPLGRAYLFQVRASRSDTPKIVGEHGKTVRALMTLVNLWGRKHSVECQFQLLEPETGNPAPMRPFQRKDKWDCNPLVELALAVGDLLFLNKCVRVDVIDEANLVSGFHLIVQDSEPNALVQAAVEPFKVIFNAIGKGKGRVLHPDIFTESGVNQTVSGFAPVNIG